MGDSAAAPAERSAGREAIDDLAGRADSGASLLGFLCMAIGAVILSTMWILDAEEARHHELLVAALGAGALGGTLLWAQAKAKQESSLLHVGGVLVVMGVVNHGVTGSLGPYRIVYVLIFAFVGLVHPPKTAFKLLPLAVATYVVPELTNDDLALALAGTVVAVPVWLLAAEGLAHVTRRLRQANSALAERNLEVERHAAFQRDFVATASHELRTPMTSIVGYVELLEEADDLDEDQRKHLQVISKNAARLQALVNDLLTLNKQETGHMEPAVTATSVEDVVSSVAEAQFAACRSKRIALRVDVPSGLPRILVDPGQIEQVLGNLMSNAVKFTLPGGTVDVRCAGRDDRLEVSISDTGPGIPSDEVDRVFDRFFRSSTSIKMAVPGTGLGLAIAKSMVESQNGQIHVESTVGKGTTFTVTLPTERVGVGAHPGS